MSAIDLFPETRVDPGRTFPTSCLTLVSPAPALAPEDVRAAPELEDPSVWGSG